jgi:hypothetical protein
VSTGDTGTRGSGPGDFPRRRVLLLAESAGLAAVLHHLLDPADRLSRLGTLRELAETRALENADVVILDVAAEDRAGAVEQVRRRYLGPLVVLVAKGDDTGGLHLDDAATLLTRPFSAEALRAALMGPGRPPGLGPFWATIEAAAPIATTEPAAAASARETAEATPTAEGPPKAAVDLKAAARKAPVVRAPATPPGQLDLVDRVQRALIALTQGWKARRRVRVAGFSAFALVAFTVAFALASQGRCGPGCDAFGTVFAPAPTIAASQSTAPSTTGPKRSTTTAASSGAAAPGTGVFRGISGGRLATTTTRQATTTTRRPVATTRPATTRSATTKPTTPPTTAPTTTAAPPTTAPPTTGGA